MGISLEVGQGGQRLRGGGEGMRRGELEGDRLQRQEMGGGDHHPSSYVMWGFSLKSTQSTQSNDRSRVR